ncbi:M14 family zinc carboxypeptidase [Lewinella sp. 4G2]|uniref:M14 family zinc carboxypeptidase n=1 Tax=Lewinella sp. 4G2 TaxID=1803372 RepID=UPI0007B46954|nr:M14 family zinc carboxypeptidase [Lewinella sp. 4G2]OAV46263.1 hypothetical protein A3850_018580 [Lewinella sp. 4G2]
MKYVFLFVVLLPLCMSGTVLGQEVGRSSLPGTRGSAQLFEQRIEPDKLVPQDRYPTYQEYEELMYTLARTYPDRCALERWGTLPSGKQILTLRLSENVRHRQGKPQVLLTAAMHGDELAGYWLLLNMAEKMLRGDHAFLLGDLEVFINPLANPDGAYYSSDQHLLSSRRGNRNGVDLNRNYPDPDDGAHPDNRTYQPETEIFMRAAADHSFDLALNIHGGAEVFNYPWDTYRNRHPDNVWWRRISREFAQRAQISSGRDGYFEDRQNGVTNGHDWYPISGSRQDYMNYYHRCREATLEVSDAKRFPADDLTQLWDYVSGPIYGYVNEARNGLHGEVVDDLTGDPIPARIYIPGHDKDNSDVFADGDFGDFQRYLADGEYEVEVSAKGYLPQRHRVIVRKDRRTKLEVRMRRRSEISR